MFCPNCGANVNNGSAFCGSCGSNLQQQNNSMMQNNNMPQNNMPQNNPTYQNGNNLNSETNKSAIISLVLSVIALFIFGFLCIPGIIYGFKATKEIEQTKEKGKALAIIGIVVGFIDLAFLILGALVKLAQLV